MTTTIAEFFKDLTLPTMPEVAQALIQSLNDEEAPLSHLREAIERDPVLAVKLLRLANSARYGKSRSVSSIDDAIALVGTAQVRALALASCLNDAFPVAPGLDRDNFWRDSQATGGRSQWLASGISSDSQQAWLTGFMVRLGELLMGMKSPSYVMEIERQPRSAAMRWAREEALLGFTEGQASAELARCWNFPDAMVNALAAVADPMAAEPFSELGAVLHLAELLSAADMNDPEAVDNLPADVLAALKVDAQWMRNRLPGAQAFVDASTLH